MFAETNTKVVPLKLNTRYDRKIDVMSEGLAGREYFENLKHDAQIEAFEKSELDSALAERRNSLNQQVVTRYIRESQIPNIINSISTTAKTAIFKDILFEVFYNSLLLDKEFLVENCKNLKALTDKYIDDNGGFEVLNKAVKNNLKNELLKRIKACCESVAMEVCSRKIADAKEVSADYIDFDMNDDEKSSLEDIKANDLNIEKISDLVKDKVLTVVRDEQERHKAESEKIDAISEELKADEDVTDEKSLDEAMHRIVINKSHVQESTLFDSLFQDTYRDYLTETTATAAAANKVIRDNKERARHYDVDSDEEDMRDDEVPPTDNEHGTAVNMDKVMAEALTKYTLMEMLYTLGLENYTTENIRKLTDKMVNPVHESMSVVTEDADFVKNRSQFFKHFNSLLNDPTSESARSKFTKWVGSIGKGKCKGFSKIADSEIDRTIKKNPGMKKKYNDLRSFIHSTCK